MRLPFFALILAVTLFLGPAHARSLVLVTNIDFAPYSMLSEGAPAGIDVEAMHEAARRAGVNVDIRFEPWDKVLSMVRNGECDGAFPMFKSPAREQYAIFYDAQAVHMSDYVLFTKVGTKFSFRTYADLSGKTIGLIKGTDLGAEFQAAAQAGTMAITEYDDLTGAMRGLLNGEIDAYAGNIDVTYARLKTMGMTSSIVYLPKKILSQKPAYLVMSRKSTLPGRQDLFQKLENALDTMRKDGTYNTIARRYLIRY